MRFALLFLAGCGLATSDLDGDGFTVADGDCDDWDPQVHPGSPDLVADGIDDDCDGLEPVEVASGVAHTCTLFTDGRVRCTGDDTWGQLQVPTNPFPFAAVVAGDHHSCALDLQGSVICWGDDRVGQSSPPEDLGRAERVGAGPDFSFAEGSALERVCWGRCP